MKTIVKFSAAETGEGVETWVALDHVVFMYKHETGVRLVLSTDALITLKLTPEVVLTRLGFNNGGG